MECSDEGEDQPVRVVPRGENILTLKAQGKLIEGSLGELREELYLARRAIQYVIDALWELDKLPSINQTHQIFYKILRKRGFRAHQCKQVYKYALGIVRSAKRNKGCLLYTSPSPRD